MKQINKTILRQLSSSFRHFHCCKTSSVYMSIVCVQTKSKQIQLMLQPASWDDRQNKLQHREKGNKGQYH